ncbi:MAG: hypothetical protein H8E16_14270 [Flavobacteriales bacterium]|nr:hypothetical protein [Flavobacteriales bacterium]
MPITIQEIIASDTISQLVDKTNFNFDQLLLNGGGPAGPAGPAGPTGPAGGRGPKGTKWYEDNSSVLPGTVPTASFPTTEPLEADYYLQLNGQVWEYTGLTWSQTTINLIGPQGPAGQSGGFGLEYGSPTVFTDKTAVYNGPIGEGFGATTQNEGIPSVMIGGATEYTQPLGTIQLTPAYRIPNQIASGTISSTVSLLLHQRDITTKSIVFHGGRETTAPLDPTVPGGNPDNFNQSDINILSNIAIGYDDKLVLNVPKIATSPGSTQDLVGFYLDTPTKTQEFRAGKAITFQTGVRAVSDFAGENSDFIINVGQGSTLAGNKFELATAGDVNTTLIQAGGGFPVLQQTGSDHTGVIQMLSGLINLTSSVNENIQLNAGGQLKLDTTLSSNPAGTIELTSGSGGILGQVSNNGNITLQQSDSSTSATGNINIINSSTAPNTTAGGDIYIKGNSQIYLQNAVTSDINAPSIVIDYGYHQSNDPTKPLLPHTRFAGRNTWQRSNMGVTIYPDSGGGSPYQFNYLDSTLTTASSIFRKTGDQFMTDVIAGAKYERWVGGTAAQTNEPMHQITIMQGNEGSPAGYPITTPYEAYDNSLTLKVSDKDETKDYVTISKNKIGVAAPLVLKRTNEANSNNNSAPGYPNVPNLSYQFGWDPRNFDPTPDSSANGGMPTTADLNVPYIEIGVGIGYGSPSPYTYNRENKNYTFNFPVGQYPGQVVRVVMYNQAYSYRTTVPGSPFQQNWKYYGDFTLRIPQTRMQRPLGNPYTSWWSTTEPGASRDIVLSMSAGDDALGVGKRAALDLMWNGTKAAVARGYPQTGTADNLSTALIEYGWDIVSFSFISYSWNVNRANSTSGTGPIPTTPVTGVS